jgi:hypothetical protein
MYAAIALCSFSADIAGLHKNREETSESYRGPAQVHPRPPVRRPPAYAEPEYTLTFTIPGNAAGQNYMSSRCARV